MPFFKLCAMFQLLAHRQREDVSADGELRVDLGLREAEVRDVEEADVVDGVAELGSELLFAIGLVEEGEVDGYEGGPVEGVSRFGDLGVGGWEVRRDWRWGLDCCCHAGCCRVVPVG